jgi:hypothetical protein
MAADAVLHAVDGTEENHQLILDAGEYVATYDYLNAPRGLPLSGGR